MEAGGINKIFCYILYFLFIVVVPKINSQKGNVNMKKLLAIVLGLAMGLSLAACGAAPSASTAASASAPGSVKSEEKAKIGACVMSLSYDFQLQMCNGVERAAKEKGYEAMIYDFNSDNEQMLTGLDTLKASNVKAMYGLFTAPEAASSFMLENPDIGVLAQGQQVEGCQAWTVNDYNKLAEQFVEALEYHVTENGITEGKVAGLWLDNCQNPDNDYYQAKADIEKVISDWCTAHGFEYIPSEYYPLDDEAAANMTAQIMNADPDVKFFFCFNNGYGIACSNEIASAVPDVSDYFVFSSEGDAEVFRLIADDSSPFRACAYANIEESGYQVGLQLINWVENGKMENVAVSKDLVDSRNVADYNKQ